MRRRRVLAALGTGVAVGLAGCGGSPGGGSGTASSGAGGSVDGLAPASAVEETPPSPDADPGSFDTVTYEGTPVPLVPIDVAYDWYRRREARFADARPAYAYEAAHVLGAALSPAPTGQERGDPAVEWPAGDRIVTYCGCPHHLSSMRAGTLIDAGYERVYALDEGFGEWADRAYPMAGEKVTNRQRLVDRPAVRVVRGRVPADAAEGYAWARHEPTGQREAAPIAADGSYELHLKFREVSAASVVTVETPAYTVREPLGELTDGRVAADGRRA